MRDALARALPGYSNRARDVGRVGISTTAIYTHLDFEHLMAVYQMTHPHAISKATSQIRANAPDIATPSSDDDPRNSAQGEHRSHENNKPPIGGFSETYP
jgi:hypothetical protein